MNDFQTADPKHEADAEGAEKLHRGAIIGPGAHDDECAFAQIIGALGEAFVFVRLAAKGFDLADALEVVHQQGVHGARGFALDAVAFVGGERVPERAANEKRHGNQAKPA